jgi:hypothetical protein
MVDGSRLMVDGSWLMVHGLWLVMVDQLLNTDTNHY